MSAVPKKKLCWHCDGNVAKEIDNCPYCGVYLLATDDTEANRWSPDYRQSDPDAAVPSPLYQMQEDADDAEPVLNEQKIPLLSSDIIQKLKLDLGPILMLMCGSVFFLFSAILFLFAQDGVLTLQWNADNWIYFLIFSIPLVLLGWHFLQQIDPSEE
jgi:hypothetical protein